MAAVLFKFGSQAAYNALDNYDSNALYFIEDTNRLYKGKVLMSEQLVVTDKVPNPLEAVEGKIYAVVTEDGASLYLKHKDQMVPASNSSGGELVPGSIDSIDLFNDDLLTKSQSGEDNDKIPTEGAVKEIVDEATKDVVEWSRYPDDQNRKAIVLANHDSLSGTMTDGDGANLVMLSKWNVADFGSTKVHMNLNTEKADRPKVTVNDHDVVALISEDDFNAGKKVAVVEEGKEVATKEDLPTWESID